MIYLGAEEGKGEADQSCAGTELEDTPASKPPGREAAFVLQDASACQDVATRARLRVAAAAVPSGVSYPKKARRGMCVLPCREEDYI